jgi:hypothetical protein
VRGIRWCEGCRNKGKAQLSSARDGISERITLAFQTLSRPEAIRGSTIEKQDLLDISIGAGGESVSQSPLMQKLFFIPARGNLRSWLPAIGPSRAPAAPQASAQSSVDLDAAAGQAISACSGDARKTLKGLIAANDFLRS